jgi:DNA-binding transcriptional LysR family regulator
VIQGVEAAAGARLFDRSTRHVELTPEGRLLEQWARRLLEDFEAAFSNLQDHVHLRTGRIGVSALPTIAGTWLPLVLAKYQSEHPGVAIELFDTLADSSLELVRQGRADFALTATGALPPDLEAERLFDERFHLLCRQGDPLLDIPSLQLTDIAGRPFIHMVRSSSIRQQLEARFSGIPLHVAFEVAHLGTVVGLVAAGLGVSVLPEWALPRSQARGLCTRPLSDPGLHRTIFLVRGRGRSLSQAAQAMYEMVRRHEAHAVSEHSALR